MTLLDKIKKEPKFLASINVCVEQATPILKKYISNFPEYTDHSIDHSNTVLKYADYVLSETTQILNVDEAYVLIMSCYLHDIGMCPNKTLFNKLKKGKEFKDFEQNAGGRFEDYLRHIHQDLSYNFIIENWKKLGIINTQYAKAIAIVSMGHRQKDLLDFDVFVPDFVVKSGKDFVCLPFLSAILRLADELDITNDRTPELLFDKFLPESTISQSEWRKHKSTYFVNFSNNLIIITAKCSDLNLYSSIKKHFHKIDEVLKYTQKIIRSLPRDEKQRELKISYTRVEEKIETEGFTPKNIGFSFDIQNTLDTFIGKNLYKDIFVSIREVLQNSIDTCHYKKVLNVKYVPEIKVFFDDNNLTIEDNGMGMDDFIIENFFARMSNSYYKQNKIVNSFEPIGEFGIGVMSYFMLCDYFEVETKMDAKDPIRFRVTKNANSDFFFYSTCEKKITGTKIVFYLKEKMVFDKLLESIKHFMRFIDIDIVVGYKSRKEIITCNKFDLEVNQTLNSKINIVYQDKIKDLAIVKKYLSNDIYEGVVGLIIKKDDKFIYRPEDYMPKYFNDNDYRSGNINVCQQGIFLNKWRNNNLWGLTGDINLKKKHPLDLSRNRVTNRQFLDNIINDFEFQILKDLFLTWEGHPLEDRVTLYKQFLSHTLSNNITSSQNIRQLIIENVVVEVFQNGELKNVLLKDFLNNKIFLLFKAYSDGKIEYNFSVSQLTQLSKYFKQPILLSLYDINDRFFLRLLINSNYNLKIVSDKNKWYYSINTEKRLTIVENIFGKYMDCLPFNDKQICGHPGIDTYSLFNLNHPIIKFAVSNETLIKENQVVFSLFQMFFERTSGLLSDSRYPYQNVNYRSRLQHINSILQHINNILKTNFVLTKKDFAPWLQKEI